MSDNHTPQYNWNDVAQSIKENTGKYPDWWYRRLLAQVLYCIDNRLLINPTDGLTYNIRRALEAAKENNSER